MIKKKGNKRKVICMRYQGQMKNSGRKLKSEEKK
jgi:hypothetical protein